MDRQRISSGSTFEEQVAYSRAVACGDVRPAVTMFAAPLVEPRIKIEIEITARKRR
ncbi:MAG: hypothetical protein ACI85K_003489 [Hyphomicrobiaceae bacterium]|jgi:enamine deaminase RidA (YjgF/YER057c/UK114 family)